MKGFFSKSQLAQTKQFVPTIARCGVCGLCKTCKTPKMKPYGEGKKKILIIAEAPGSKEDEVGKPMVGKTGIIYETTMANLGVKLSRDCVKTNACICHTHNQTPDDTKIEACRPNVIKVITEMKPNVIILLGVSAAKSVLGWLWKEEKISSISTWVGMVIPNRQINAWICPTYHPAYLKRMQDKTLDLLFERHLKRAVAKAVKKPYSDKVKINVIEKIYDTEMINEAIHGFTMKADLCSFDYETNTLKPDSSKAKIKCCSISNGKRTIAFPWSDNNRLPAMNDFLKNIDVGKIACNLKFEDRWTRAKLGFGVVNWAWDTMLAAHVIDYRPKITSLKFQAFATLGYAEYNSHIESMLKSKGGKINRIDEIDMNDLLEYCGLDSLFEYKLAIKQMKILGVKLWD